MKSTSIYFAFIFIKCISIINGDVDDIKITRDEYVAVENSMNFRGKVILVTGSSSGIGAATVRLFSYLGAHVVVTGRNETRLKEVAKDCWELSPGHLKPLRIKLDLSIPGHVAKLFNETIKAFKKIDILVNNAGILRIAQISDPSFSNFYKELRTINEEVPVELTRLAAPYIQDTNGSIIFITSILAKNPVSGTGAYSMAKNSLIAFAMTLSHDMGSNVRVNVISPGIIDGTRIYRLMSPLVRPYSIANSIKSSALRRAGIPMDIAKAVVFLASPLSDFVTGKELQLDAGAYIPLL